MKSILICADSKKESGLGHLMRCLALAEMLHAQYTVGFICEASLPEFIEKELLSVCCEVITYPFSDQNKECFGALEKALRKYDALILDQYEYASEVEDIAFKNDCKIIRIIDGDIHSSKAHLLLSHSCYGKEPVCKTVQCKQGLEFAMLRSMFRVPARQRTISQLHTALITFGGNDHANSSLMIAKALQSVSCIKNIHIVLGSWYMHDEALSTFLTEDHKQNIHVHRSISGSAMVHLLESSQIAFVPASGTAIEAASVGTGLFVGLTASNQDSLYRQLIDRDIAFGLGDLRIAQVADVENKIKSISIDSVQALVQRQKEVFDGRSDQRLVEAIGEVVDD